MKKYLALSLILASCSSSQDSETKWAHSPADRSWGTVPALVSYLDLGFKTNFEKLNVCLQGSDSFQGAALLLESKLSYAAWLNAGGQGQAAFDRFQFEIKDNCDPKDSSYASVVIIESQDKTSSGRDPSEGFSKATVNCQKSGWSVRCGSGSTTFGWGGPAAVGYSYRNPSKWESVSSRSPASVRLSPFVSWRSLEADLLEQKNLSEVDRTMKLDLYRSLLNRADSVTFSELVDFMKSLSDTQLVAGSDGNFQKLMKEFQNSGSSSLNQEYIPTATALHVLLHEVGHQFGMDHADNPSLDSETGFVVESQQRGNQWVTSEASMAYGKPFLFLTADDQAGVLDMTQKTRAFLQTRR